MLRGSRIGQCQNGLPALSPAFESGDGDRGAAGRQDFGAGGEGLLAAGRLANLQTPPGLDPTTSQSGRLGLQLEMILNHHAASQIGKDCHHG